MALALDTHTLVWIATGDTRLSDKVRRAIESPETALRVSAAVAWEYADLEQRGRFPGSGPLSGLQEQLGFVLLDLPGSLWTVAAKLPPIHRDPVDRMLIAHAISLDMILVTADKTIHRYPVKTLW